MNYRDQLIGKCIKEALNNPLSHELLLEKSLYQYLDRLDDRSLMAEVQKQEYSNN